MNPTNKPMTAEEILRNKFSGSFLDLEYLELIIEAMEEYAQSAQQQPQIELHPCDCGHKVPNEFVYSNGDGITMCSKCMMEYKNDKIQELQERIHDLDVLAEMNAEACERATKIFRKDHPDFVSRNAIPDNTTAINYVCDLLEKQQPQESELPSEQLINDKDELITIDEAVKFHLWIGANGWVFYSRENKFRRPSEITGSYVQPKTYMELYKLFKSKQKGETNE